MGEAEEKVLKMLADGLITADDAHTLLGALNAVEEPIATGDRPPAGEVVVEASPRMPSGLMRLQRLWRMLTYAAAAISLLSISGLWLVYQSEERLTALAFLCLWSLFIVALVATGLFLLGRRSTWFYLRVEERAGTRIAFGFPIPLRLMSWAVNLAERFVPEAQAVHLQTAAAFVSGMKENMNASPIIIDVDDEDGDTVQVYIG